MATVVLDKTKVGDELVNEQSSDGSACPKCKSTTPWNTSSWCPDCGYYPGVSDLRPEFEQPVVEEVQAEPQAPPPLMPPWMAQAMVSTTCILIASACTRYYFTFYGGDRGLVAFLVLVAGTFLAIGTQFKVTFASAQQDTDISPLDAIGKPVEVWRSTLEQLPETGGRITAMACGLTAMFAAVVVIGGIDFESLFEREAAKKKPEPTMGIMSRMLGAAATMAPPPKPDDEQPETLEEALYALGPIVDELKAGSLNLVPSPLEPLRCIVYGFLRDGKSGFRLLLAADVAGERVHVGEVESRDLPEHVRVNLREKLNNMAVIDRPIVKSRYRGTWVKPTVALSMKFQSWSAQGTMVSPELAPDEESY